MFSCVALRIRRKTSCSDQITLPRSNPLCHRPRGRERSACSSSVPARGRDRRWQRTQLLLYNSSDFDLSAQLAERRRTHFRCRPRRNLYPHPQIVATTNRKHHLRCELKFEPTRGDARMRAVCQMRNDVTRSRTILTGSYKNAMEAAFAGLTPELADPAETNFPAESIE